MACDGVKGEWLVARLSTRQHATAHTPASAVAPLVPQLRVLFATQRPSHHMTNQRLRALSVRLRGEGHAFLAAVPIGSLLAEDAARAEEDGIEYVFAVPRTASRTALSGWRLLLRRFQANVIHIDADVPPQTALALARATKRAERGGPVVLLEESASDGAPGALSARERERLGRQISAYVTQVICSDQLDEESRPTMGRGPVTMLQPPRYTDGDSRRMPTVAIIHDARSESGALAALQSLLPLLIARDSLRVVVRANEPQRLRQTLAPWPDEVRQRVLMAASFAEWLAQTATASCACVSPVGPWPQQALGAVLALGVPLIAPEEVLAGLGQAASAGSVPIHQNHPEALPRAVSALISAGEEASHWEPIASAPGDVEAEARRLMSIYAGAWLRAHSRADALLRI
jgi:hypothetical protein